MVTDQAIEKAKQLIIDSELAQGSRLPKGQELAGGSGCRATPCVWRCSGTVTGTRQVHIREPQVAWAGTLSAACYVGSRTIELLDRELREPGPGEVEVEVGYTGICGTDLYCRARRHGRTGRDLSGPGAMKVLIDCGGA